MHFLKCNNCGELNEVKNEYMIFCSACGKKLDNNFPDWHKRNPEMSISDFKQLICISDQDLQKVTPAEKTRKRPKGLVYWIGFAALMAISYAVTKLAGEEIVKFFHSEKTSKEVLSQNWISETYGNYGLIVDTPVKLTKSNLQIPDDFRKMIDNMAYYDYMSAKGFKILINSIRYIPEVGSVDLQGAATGSVNEVKMLKGVTDFNYSEDPLNKGEIPGLIQKGTFKQNGVGAEFINVVFASGLNVWQVCVLYESSDEVGRIASKRVIESIQIKKDEKTL